MISILLEDKSIESFQQALTSLEEKAQSVIILSAEKNQFPKEALDRILTQSSLDVIGGIFPVLVYKNTQYTQGTILLGLTNRLDIHIIEHISENKNYDDIIEQRLGLLRSDINTMFLFFDAFSNNIDAIIQALFNNYGLTINYMGGSAGTQDFQKQPILFSNKGLLEDAAVFATSTSQSTIGVKHGWEALGSETHQVTKSKGNIVYEIDYQPALEVYEELIAKYTNHTLDFNDFFHTSKFFPLGINRISGDSIVRVPSHITEGTAIACTGDIPENSSIQILGAADIQLIEAALEASRLSQNTDYATDFNLYIGCLARLLIMKENFHKELDAIYKGDELLVGALAMGEIANNKDHYLELYNATAVVAKIADV